MIVSEESTQTKQPAVETKSAESSESKEQEEEKNLDDYMAYLQGYEMNKFPNEHAKFKAAEKAMQKHQHEKVTKVRSLSWLYSR